MVSQLLVGRNADGNDAHVSRVESTSDAPDRAAFSRGIEALEEHEQSGTLFRIPQEAAREESQLG
jgi:hypothetical protein